MGGDPEWSPSSARAICLYYALYVPAVFDVDGEVAVVLTLLGNHDIDAVVLPNPRVVLPSDGAGGIPNAA